MPVVPEMQLFAVLPNKEETRREQTRNNLWTWAELGIIYFNE